MESLSNDLEERDIIEWLNITSVTYACNRGLGLGIGDNESLDAPPNMSTNMSIVEKGEHLLLEILETFPQSVDRIDAPEVSSEWSEVGAAVEY